MGGSEGDSWWAASKKERGFQACREEAGGPQSGGQKAAVDERLVASGWPRGKSLGGLSIDTGQSPRAERAC